MKRFSYHLLVAVLGVSACLPSIQASPNWANNDYRTFDEKFDGDPFGFDSSSSFLMGSFAERLLSRSMSFDVLSPKRLSTLRNAVVDVPDETNASNGVATTTFQPSFDMSLFSAVSPAQASMVPKVSTTTTLSGTGTATKYWDTTAGAGNGVGGSSTWTLQTDPLFSTSPTGDASLVAAATTDDGVFQGTAGTITLGGATGSLTLNSWTFNTTNYTITTTNGGNHSVNGPFTLASGINLNFGSAVTTASRLITIGGSVSGGAGSGLTIQGAQSAGNEFRITLSAANSTIGVPITINETGAGIEGFVATASGVQITGTITNNSTGKTMLGASAAGNDLTASGAIGGTGGLQISISGAAAGSGSGKVTLTGDNNFTGATVVNTASNGQLVLNSAAGQALGGTSGVTVSSGSLVLGKSDQINNSATMTLSGGTLRLGGFSEGSATSNGTSTTAITTGLGALSLTANSFLDFGTLSTTNKIVFGGVGTHIASTTLTITNWEGTPYTGNGADQLIFSGTATDFTSNYNQADVLFNGLAGYTTIDLGNSFYEVTAAPEPSTWAAGILAVCAVGYAQRRRFSRLAKRA